MVSLKTIATALGGVMLFSPSWAFSFGVKPMLPMPKTAEWGLLKSDTTLMAASGDEVPPGWVGGFMESNPAFAYPKPDLSSLKVNDNMKNINHLTRMQQVRWPQFSWLSEPGNEDSRIYQRFAEDISRLGYDNEGRVWSIICPQQGFFSNLLGGLNVEVTVTGNRGWVVEPEPDNMYADMSVVGKIWFNPPSRDSPLLKAFENVLDHDDFPFSKENAIQVLTFKPENPAEPLFNLTKGVDPSFIHPDFTRHDDEAYGVSHLQVQIGPIVKLNKPHIDRFNEMVLKIFNFASGNILKEDSVLAWNVWFEAPEYVNQTEWRNHAEYWRHSLQVDHVPPDGLDPGSSPQYADGTPYNALKSWFVDEEFKIVDDFIQANVKNPVLREALYAEINVVKERALLKCSD